MGIRRGAVLLAALTIFAAMGFFATAHAQTLTIGSGSTSELSGSESYVSVYNYGTATTEPGTNLNIHSDNDLTGGLLDNYAGATFNLQGAFHYHTPVTSSLTMTAGSVWGLGITPLDSDLNNWGTFNIGTLGGLTLKTNCFLYNYSTGTLNNADALESYWVVQNSSGGTINNSGTFDNYSGATLSNYGTLNTSGTLNNNTGAFILNKSTGTLANSGTLTSSGTLRNQGIINNSGTLTLASGNSYDFTGGTLNNTGTLNLYVNLTFGASSVGTLNLKAGGTLQDYAVLTNPQKNILNNYGTISINSGATLVNAFGIPKSTTCFCLVPFETLKGRVEQKLPEKRHQKAALNSISSSRHRLGPP